MKEESSGKIRTVSVNSRGQIVIPEDVRKDFGITNNSTMILIEKPTEIVLRREHDVIRHIEDDDRFWKAMSLASLRHAWGKEDQKWDKIYKEQK